MIPLSRPLIGDAEVAAVVRVLRTGQLAQGPEVAAFEEEFAAMISEGAPARVEAVAMGNGTQALMAALLGLGVGPGDDVLVPAFTFVATASAVRATGAQAVFVDVEPDTGNISVKSIEARLTPRTVAVIVVHLYGMPAEIEAIQALTDGLGLALVEDAAQAHGASVDGRQVGTFGVGCFSFYPTKNMTTGEGGMVTTMDSGLAVRLRQIRNHGMTGPYRYEGFGLNLRMTDISAAIGRVQLRHLPERTRARRNNASWLDDHITGVVTPPIHPRVLSAYHQYTVRTGNRAEVLASLEHHGVGYGIYYPTPLHQTRPYHSDVSLPAAEKISTEVVSIPVRPDLTMEELAQVARAVSV